MNSLNPVMRIRDQMLDGLYAHGEHLSRHEAERRLTELKSGKVAAIPADKVMKKARSALR